MSYDTRIQEVAHALSRGPVRLFSMPFEQPIFAVYNGDRAIIFDPRTFEIRIVPDVGRHAGYAVDAATEVDVRERLRRVLLSTMSEAVSEAARVAPNINGSIVPLHE